MEKLSSSISSLQAEVSELKKVVDVLQPLCMQLESHSACCDVSDGGAPTLLEGPRPLSCHQTPHQSTVSLSADAGRGHGHTIMREGMQGRRRAGADDAHTVVSKRGRAGKYTTADSAGPQRGRGGGSGSGGLGSVGGGVGGGGEGGGDGDGGLRGAEGVRVGSRVLHTGVKVQGVCRVWGTMRMCTSGTVQSAVSRICGINTIRVKRKTKETLHGKQPWWFLLHDDEPNLCHLEAKWCQIEVQTSWKLEFCHKPPPSNCSVSRAPVMSEDAIIATSPEIPCAPTTSDNPTETQSSPSCAALPVSELSDHLDDEVFSTPSIQSSGHQVSSGSFKETSPHGD